MDAQPAPLAASPPSSPRGHALRVVLLGGLAGVGLALLALFVLFGFLNLVLLTPFGQELADRLRPPEVGRYEYVYGALASLLAKIAAPLAVVSGVAGARRRQLAPARSFRWHVALGLIVFGAGCWGVWLYRWRQLSAENDRDLAAVKAVADRGQADAQSLGERLGAAEAAVDLPALVEPGAKTPIEERRRALDSFTQAVTAFRADYPALTARVRAELEALPISGEHKRQTLAGFDRKTAAEQPLIEALAAAELEVAAAAGQILALEARSRSLRADAAAREHQRLRSRFDAAAAKCDRALQALMHAAR